MVFKSKLHNFSHTQDENIFLLSKSIGDGPIKTKFLYFNSYCFNILVISKLDNHVYGFVFHDFAQKA